MDFVAIDFETANNSANSACQVAAVVVRNSEIIDEQCWHIRPPRMYFSSRNIAIHGIRPSDVQTAPTMAELWPSLAELLRERVIVAHNARFDLGVLVASLDAHRILCPDLHFTCTRLLARCTWPGRSRYGLKPLGQWLGIDFNHHDALEDARCCAQIAIAVEKTHGERQELSRLEERLAIKRGRYAGGRMISPRRIGKRGEREGGPARQHSDRWGFPNRQAKLGSINVEAVVTASAAQQPLAGRKIVLLGPLRGLNSEESQRLISDLGGCCQTHIAPDTDYVIACGTSLDAASQIVTASVAEGYPSSDSSERESRGIRVLSERQFRALLPAGKASARW